MTTPILILVAMCSLYSFFMGWLCMVGGWGSKGPAVMLIWAIGILVVLVIVNKTI